MKPDFISCASFRIQKSEFILPSPEFLAPKLTRSDNAVILALA